MDEVALLLRYLIIFGFFYLIYRMLMSVNVKVRKRPDMAKTEAGEDMVKDPNCNTYISLGSAIKAGVNGETVYFCSTECEREYRNR